MPAQALSGALRLFAHSAGIDATARDTLGQGRGRDGAPDARRLLGFDAVMVEHRAIIGGYERRAAGGNLASLGVEIERKAGKRPCDVGHCDRTVWRHTDKHAPYRTLCMCVAD